MSLPMFLSDLELAEAIGAPLEIVHQCRDRSIITPPPDGRYPRLALFAVALAWAVVPIFPPGPPLPYEFVRELAPKFHVVLGDLRAVPKHVSVRYQAGPPRWQIGLLLRVKSRQGPSCRALIEGGLALLRTVRPA